MKCDPARQALLEVDLPIDDGDSSELASHLRDCAECARRARSLERDTFALAGIVRRRSRKRRRIVLAAATATLAASATFVALARLPRSAPISPSAPSAPVNAEHRGIVSVDVPRGKTAMVLQTNDPNVTIIWVTDAPRNGS
jgi:hypothetical protein